MNRLKFIPISIIIMLIITMLPTMTFARSKIDIVFIIDRSGSMGDDIAAVRREIGDFANLLSNQGIDYRLGLITYEKYTEVSSMTNNVNTFKNYLSNVRVSGGTENGLDGIADAIDLYVYDVSALKYFILIGDENIYSRRGHSIDSIKQKLINNDVILTSVCISRNRSQFKQLSDATGGLCLSLTSDFGNNLTSIFEQIQAIPILEVNSPTPNQLLSDFDSSFIPMVTASDPDSDTLEFSYYIDSETSPRDTRKITNTTSEQTVSFNSIDIGTLSEGQHSFRFTVDDGSDTVQDVVNVTVDKLAPILGTINMTSTDKSITASGSATDNVSGMAAKPYRYTVDSIESDWITNTSYSVNSLTPNTEYQVKFEARDVVGHIASKEETICTKSQIPDLSITNATETTLEISTQDQNPQATEYQIKVGTSYIDQLGKLTSSPTWITLTNKKIILTGLTSNTSYNIGAKTRNQEGEQTKFRTQITGTTMAQPPANITLTPHQNSMEISWDEIIRATSYDIEADGQVENTGTNTSYTHNGLSPDTGHTYRIRANNQGGIGNWSNSIIETTLPYPPAIPCNIQTAVEQTQISINWDPVVGAESYIIEVDEIEQNIETSTCYTHSSLQAETEHTYRIKAINRGGVSSWSELITEITLPYPPDTPTHITTEKTKNSITLVWDQMDRATGYEIEVDGIITDNETNTTFLHEGLEPLSGHTYRIRAVNRGGKSSWCEQIDITTYPEKPKNPENIMATSEENLITVTWYKVENAESYDIEVDGNIITDITDTMFIHNGLNPNTEHAYRVRAKNVSGISEWSKPLTMPTLPRIDDSSSDYSLTNIIAIVTNNTITLSWDAVALDAVYQIEVDGELKNIGENTIYNHTELEADTFHIYKIRIKDENGTSDWCGVLALATLPNPPDAPENIEVYTDNNMIELRWEKIDGAAGYDVEIDGTTIYNGSETTYIHTDLEPGTSHVYRVRAKNITGVTAWSDAIIESTTNPTYVVGCTSGNLFNLSLLASNVQDFTELKFVVTYNPEEIEVVDLNSFTPQMDLNSQGKIDGTDLYVEHTYGRIEFTVDKSLVPGTSWSGEITDILFRAKIDGESNIDYVVE